MDSLRSCQVHPSAIISSDVRLGDGVIVGPYAVLDGKVRIGPECVIKPHVYVTGEVTMGRGNVVYPGTTIGEQPQHRNYAGEPTRVEIGNFNIFRENVTVHRGTTQSWITKIGSHNYFMAGSHVAHDCVVGNHCNFANNALLGGHCIIADQAFLSGNTGVHQFVQVGRLAFISGCSSTTMDVPPFMINQYHNVLAGVNVVGMRRAGMTPEQMNGVRRAFQILTNDKLLLPELIAKLQEELGHIDSVQEIISFLQNSKRGISVSRSKREAKAA